MVVSRTGRVTCIVQSDTYFGMVFSAEYANSFVYNYYLLKKTEFDTYLKTHI